MRGQLFTFYSECGIIKKYRAISSSGEASKSAGCKKAGSRKKKVGKI